MVDNLKEIIHKSQICQRNWDLSEEIPQEHVDLIVEAVTQSPTRQNIPFYNVDVVTDRSLINSIHNNSAFFKIKPGMELSEYSHAVVRGSDVEKDEEGVITKTNPQVLAPLLLVFSANEETYYDNQLRHGKDSTERVKWEKDVSLSIGVASGFAKLISTQLGYVSGFCACYGEEIDKLIGSSVRLFLGIGNPDKNKKYTESHIEEFEYPSFKDVKRLKPVKVEWHNG